MIGRIPRIIPRAASLALAAVALVLAVSMVTPEVASASSLFNILTSAAPIVIIGVGLGVVVLAGEIDISVGSMFGLLAAVLGVLSSPSHANLPVWLVGVIVITAGACAGLLNGLLTVVGRIPSIVATLGTMSILRGATEQVLQGQWVTDLPPSLRTIGTGSALGVPISVLVGVATLALGVILTRATPWGVGLYATGDNANAARYARIKPAMVRLTAFVISGSLVGLAALVSVPQLSVVDSGLGRELELQVITAIVVGGVSIRGGRGTLAGVAMAAVLLATIRSSLNFLKLGPSAVYWEQAIHGVFILAAVLADRDREHRAAPADASPASGFLPLIAAPVLILAVAWWSGSEVLTVSMQTSLAPQIAEVALLCVPMMFVILTGGIDLSVGSTMALAAVSAGMCMKAGLPAPLCALAAVLVGAAGGMLNGLAVTRAKIPPLIATLATLALYRGLAQGVSGAAPVSGFPAAWLACGGLASLIPAILLFVLGAIVLGRGVRGVQLRAIGMNETAARYCGVPVDRLKLWAYTFSGAAAGLAACIFIARRNTAKADIASGIELEVITACVLGGVSLAGGRGRILGVALGLLIIHELRQLLADLQYTDETVLIALGAVLILSVLAGTHRPRFFRSPA